MPSGSRGGFSRGGRSSSSFRSSSSSSRGGRSSSGFGGGGYRPHRHHGPRHWRFGRSYIIISPRRGRAMSAVGFFLVLSVIVGAIGLFMMMGANSTMNTIKVDRDYYLQMITTAEANPSVRIREATVTYSAKSDNNPKWYIDYKILVDGSTTSFQEGYSYPVYTVSTVPAEGSKIMVAINRDTVDKDVKDSWGDVITPGTDSVPVDYKNFALSDDGEYANAESNKSLGTTLMIAGIAVVVLLIVLEGYIALSAKRATEAEVQAQKAQAAETQAAAVAATTCKYCGARVGAEDRNCSACGATIKQ